MTAWERAFARKAHRAVFADFDLAMVVGLRPPLPPEYAVPDLVGLTFRLAWRNGHRPSLATIVDVAGVHRMSRPLGLTFAEALALVDSHERIHVALQLAGVDEATEEDASRIVDAVLLSLWTGAADRHLVAGPFGIVSRVGPDFWEELLATAEDRHNA